MVKLGGAGSPSSWFDVQTHQIVRISGVMVVYSVEGDAFSSSKPRLWTDKLIGTTAGSIPFGGGRPPFDLTPDGRRIIAWEPQEQPKDPKANLHVTVLLNWSDELRRRLPPSGK